MGRGVGKGEIGSSKEIRRTEFLNLRALIYKEQLKNIQRKKSPDRHLR